MSSFMLLVAWAWAVILIFRYTFELVHTQGLFYNVFFNSTYLVNDVTILLDVASIIILFGFVVGLILGKNRDKKLLDPM